MGRVRHLGLSREPGQELAMLSRVALRSGAFGSTFKALTNQNQAAVVRCMSAVTGSENKTVQNWVEANKLYYGPERDHKNFPHTTRPVHHPDVRLGFIPDSWFTAFYDKTGVTWLTGSSTTPSRASHRSRRNTVSQNASLTSKLCP